MGKKSGSGNNPDHIFESLETIFWVKILGNRDGKNSDPGRKKFGSEIRDKHPGLATLSARYRN
jgi:hypothetical protein